MRYLLTLAIILLASPVSAVLTKTYTVIEGGGGDYTTVQAAESAHDQDMVANDSAITFEISGTWTGVEAFFNFNASVTDATRFFTVTTIGDSRAGTTFNTTAYRVSSQGNNVQMNDPFDVIDGIQVEITETDAGALGAVRVNQEGVVIKNCFITGVSGSGVNVDGIRVTSAGSAIVEIRNNISIDMGARGIEVSSATGGTKVDNNTIENCATGIFTQNEDAIARNNIIWNNTTPLSGNFNPTTLSEENYTDAGSLSYGTCGSCGTGDQLSQSDPFENLAGGDYALASGATAIDAGKDLSGDFTDAIGLKTRDALFDKGADEFIAPSGNKVLIRVGMIFWRYGIMI